MGTRGCVCWREKDGSWLGAYNHFDSYPAGLGEEVWQRCRDKGSMEYLIERLKRYRRWECMVDCREPVEEDKLFDPRYHPVFMEWVYLLDPKSNTIEVYSNCEVPPTKKAPEGYIVDAGYTHVLVEKINCCHGKPDFDTIRRVNTEEVFGKVLAQNRKRASVK